MIQKQFAMALDGISHLYMRMQKKREPQIFFPGGLDEFLADNNPYDPEAFFASPGSTPDVKFVRTAKRFSYDIHHFTFPSYVRTPHPENNTVHGRLYEIHGRPAAPTVIVLHGWHMENYNFFDYYCRLLADAGFNSILIDLPYHINRRADGHFHGEFTFSEDAVLTLLVMKQCVVDIRGAINWVRSRGAPLCGIFGVSYGAMLGGMVGCVEPEVDFMMLVVPPADLYDFFTRAQLGKLFEAQNPGMHEEVLKRRELFEAISLVNMKPKMSPENIFLVNADYDGMVRPEMIDRLWYAWERPYIERYVHGHLSVILFNPSMNRDMRRWLKTVCDPEKQQPAQD